MAAPISASVIPDSEISRRAALMSMPHCDTRPHQRQYAPVFAAVRHGVQAPVEVIVFCGFGGLGRMWLRAQFALCCRNERRESEHALGCLEAGAGLARHADDVVSRHSSPLFAQPSQAASGTAQFLPSRQSENITKTVVSASMAITQNRDPSLHHSTEITGKGRRSGSVPSSPRSPSSSTFPPSGRAKCCASGRVLAM